MSDREFHGVPAVRARRANGAPVRADGEYVLYWMIAARRLRWNFALQAAAGYARSLDRPLLVLEAVRVGYRWASDRMHRFVLDGMIDNARAARRAGIAYHPYVEPEADAGKGLLETLGSRACVVVTDEFPCFFLPRMVEAAAAQLPVRLLVVDSNGLLPLRAADRAYTSAYHFRRFLQRELPGHLDTFPAEDPLAAPVQSGVVPADVAERWPAVDRALLEGGTAALDRLPIDHAVPPVPFRGGSEAANGALHTFLGERLDRYAEERNDPDADVTSGLSPYLHWGHLSVHQIVRALGARERWEPSDVARSAHGKRSGWWHMSAPAEAFLDELITWREVGYNTCTHVANYDAWDSLPEWALATLADHEADPRPYVYERAAFEEARTHDPLWNAAQRQLRTEGRIHNYLRMLWGKKILEWSATPHDAHALMIELNNRWSIDGRNPNSYAGISWVLGRYDRPWPERAIYGKVRSMSSDSTRRKVAVSDYLERWGA